MPSVKVIAQRDGKKILPNVLLLLEELLLPDCIVVVDDEKLR